MAEKNNDKNVPLPCAVEEMIAKICTQQDRRPLETNTRSTLASLGEEVVLNILRKFSGLEIKQSFDGLVPCLAKQLSPNINASSSPPNIHSSLSSSPQQPQNRSPITDTRLLMNSQSDSGFQSPIPLKLEDSSIMDSQRQRGSESTTSQHLVALGELEFRKAFLILNYLGGKNLEEVVSADQIRGYKDLPMREFESKIWDAFGCRRDYKKEEDRVKYLDWDSGKAHIYHCHVDPDGRYRFKGPYLSKLRNVLQRTLGDDNILMVKFEEVKDERYYFAKYSSLDDYFAKYNKVLREGIHVGLRCYRFFVFKDGGKEEKKKDPTTSPVKCFFVRMESVASIDNQDHILCGKTVRQARSVFMHVNNLPSLSNYMARFSLILSKTMNLEVDLSFVDIKTIADEPCRDKDGNVVYGTDGKPLIHTDGTGFISYDLALKCPKNQVKGTCLQASNIEPLLIQFRLFNNGRAVKGTFLVNKKLTHHTLHVRRSMIKVETDPKLSNTFSKNSLEIVGTSFRPKKTFLSKNLIALLSYGGVPEEFFMGILNNALEDAHGILSNKNAALRVALNYGDMDDNIVATMIGCGIPLEEPFLQHRLSILMKEEKKSLRGGKIPVPESYYLMGTADPTGLLESNEVCIILDCGQVSGEVLVYRNPGLHFGDIHILKATYVRELEDFVGNAKYGIFFPCKGPRSLADEMSGGDFDGDMFFVSRNPQLLENFKQTEPWRPSTSTPNVPNRKPSEFSDEELEVELFKLFLRTRFQPSFTVGVAADSWLAMMDRLLTLGNDCTEEIACVKANINRLIDIYYDALDAPKKGGRKIEVPEALKAELFPHFMEKNKNITYRSTSILGRIYDKVKAYEDMDLSSNDVWEHPCFDGEVHEPYLVKWKRLYDQYRSDMCNALQPGKEKNDEANEVIKKYKEILYEAAEFNLSKRRDEEIFKEARALYHVTYSHAKRQGAVGKCGFAWRVAGLALCTLYVLKNQDERPMICSPSALKGIL
ncbi:RNA-dependent RNA polymerase 5 [Populus alba x Populus x berolinensis]|uniref:RNA-dependent RNA polymerase n=1 Tax=Populus alba x Populus x berolinensis TaxID=444605 RepID=A0AAD6QNZ8_9ROSI|nr:RNA-dependent RNA polymerase 5 [Populus alba x Populus x berolinensis]